MTRYTGRKDASFLGLPIELRLMIYKLVIASLYCDFDNRWNENQYNRSPAIRLHLIGTGPPGADGYCVSDGALVKYSREGKPRFFAPDGHSPWAMSRVCRVVHAEVVPLLNSIGMADILFDFEHFNEDEMRRWISLPSADRSGEERVKGIRRWSMSNWGYCSRASYNNAWGRREDMKAGVFDDDMKEFNDQLLQFPGTDSDLLSLGLSDA